jgi:hypothetical protein
VQRRYKEKGKESVMMNQQEGRGKLIKANVKLDFEK